MLANKPLASVPLASSACAAYTLTAEVGVYSYTGVSAELVDLSGLWITRGGVGKPKKQKIKKVESVYIRNSVEKAVNKLVYGIDDEKQKTLEPTELSNKENDVDFSPFISELVAQAQAEALNLTLQEYMRLEAEAEADDEEALLILLGGF